MSFSYPLTKGVTGSHFMNLFGPDGEVVEIFGGEQNHRFNHVHLITDDVNATSQWYADHLGLALPQREVSKPADPERF